MRKPPYVDFHVVIFWVGGDRVGVPPREALVCCTLATVL